MTVSTSAKYFTNLMTGAPQLTNAWGDLVNLLDACLVNGFNLKTLTTLTQSGGVATATVAAGHGFAVDQVVLIAGAAEPEYNGEARVLTATATTFTFGIVGTAAAASTGTITAKVAPLGFEIAFTGTNKRVYRSKNILSNRPYLRVDNSLDPAYTTTYAKKGKVTMAEGMTDVDTFVANSGRAPYDPASPTKNEIGTGSGVSAYDGWYKWYYAKQDPYNYGDSTAPNAGNRSWVLIGDDRGFYLFNEWQIYGRATYAFTDFLSFRSGDVYNTVLAASEFYAVASQASGYGPVSFGSFAHSLNYGGMVLMRDHLQVGGTVRCGCVSLGTKNSQQISGSDTGVPWPNGPDYSLILHPVYLMQESTGHLRGKLPGIMWVHNNQPLLDLTTVENVMGYAGRKFLLVTTNTGPSNTARLAFDITGPWW